MAHQDDGTPDGVTERKPCGCAEGWDRRDMLAGMAALLAAGSTAAPSMAWAAEDDPKTMKPQPGDTFVHLAGSQAGQPVNPAEMEIGKPQLAYPIDPASGVVRKTRINQVVLARVDPAELSEAMRAVSWNGIVAYSAICTHNGCPVTGMRNSHTLLCPCHESEFDLADKGKVVHGPAERRLANLPLRTTGDAITVAGPFSGTIGAQKQ